MELNWDKANKSVVKSLVFAVMLGSTKLWGDVAPCWYRAVLTGAGIPPVILVQSPVVPGLDGVVENGAIVICPFGPPQLHPCVPDLLHTDDTRRPWHS